MAWNVKIIFSIFFVVLVGCKNNPNYLKYYSVLDNSLSSDELLLTDSTVINLDSVSNLKKSNNTKENLNNNDSIFKTDSILNDSTVINLDSVPNLIKSNNTKESLNDNDTINKSKTPINSYKIKNTRTVNNQSKGNVTEFIGKQIIPKEIHSINKLINLEIRKIDSLNLMNNLCYTEFDSTIYNSHIEASKKLDSLTKLSICEHELILIDSISIFYDTDQFKASFSNKEILRKFTTKNKLTINIKLIEIKGFTDKTGSKKYNDYLSLLRVNEVKKELDSLGVLLDKAYLMNFGKKLATHDLAKDRRVDILIFEQIKN